jgi:hypothetical protein
MPGSDVKISRGFMRNRQIFRRAFLLAAAGIVVVGAVSALRAQAPPLDTKSLAFEVASVKPDGSAPLPQGVRTGMSFPPGGRFTGTYVTLRQLIVVAYGRMKPLFGFQILGGPRWIDSDRFDVVAKAEGEASVDQRRLMIQALLTDRFKLTIRTETKELPVYALVMARNDGRFGSRLRRSAVDCAAARDRRRRTTLLPEIGAGKRLQRADAGKVCDQFDSHGTTGECVIQNRESNCS